MRRSYLKRCLVVIVLTMSAGCSMAPQYQRPEAPVAKSFADRYLEESTDLLADGQTDVAGLGWRDVFVDPYLQRLIAKAVVNNRDLRIAALNVEEYQAQYRIQRANQLPTVAADGTASKTRTLTGIEHTNVKNYTVNVGTTAFELDLFGRLQSLKDAALEQYMAMEETQRSATIALVSEVARAYLTWIADLEQLRIAEDTVRIETESAGLVEERLKAGIANELELAQAYTSLESVRASLVSYRRLVAEDFHYLLLLTGVASPAEIAADNGGVPFSETEPIAVLPSSLSSEVLLQRPDIMAAEHSLRAANANIGAARAAFFPTLRLTATAGYISSKLSNLIDSSSGSYLLAPSVTVPIFTAGRLKAELDVAKIRTETSVATYEKTIQTAFREVTDGLVGVQTYQEQLQAQKANLEASQQYFQHAERRYNEGLDSFLTLLDAQRSLYISRQAYVSVKLGQLVNQVNLYAVLGGGWKENTVAAE
ncbi:MAG: efflux transporter outer membrane subunit [Desulfopila sp.]